MQVRSGTHGSGIHGMTGMARVRGWALAAAVLAGSVATPARAQVRIGLAAPLTGPDAGFGLGMRLGAEQAVAEINRTGGAGGQRLQLVVQDDAGDPRQGVAVARAFAASGVRLVVGHLNSGVASVANRVYEEAGIVAVTPGAVWPALTARGAWNVFRLCGSDAQQGALAGTWLAETAPGKPVAILDDRTPFGRALADEAARSLRARGGRETLVEGFARDDRDLSPLVRRMKAAGIEAVYFGGQAGAAAVLVRALREAGSNAVLIAGDGLLGKEFPQAAGPAAEGTLMTLAPEPRRLPAPKGATTGPAPKTPRPPEAEMFMAGAYAAVEVLRHAIEGARSAEPRPVAEFLHASRPLRTAIGEVAFDARGDLVPPPARIVAWRRTPDGRIDYLGNEISR